MIAALREVCDRMCRAYRHGTSLVLLFDYDGTLVPITEPQQPTLLDSKTKRLLARLADRPNVHVGILSWRELDELRSLVGVSGLYLVGAGGMEMDLSGYSIEHPHAKQTTHIMEHLATHLERYLLPYHGVWLEKKRLGLTIHYHQLPEQLLGSLRGAVAEVMLDFAGELRAVQAHMAWEITSANGWSKGTAVRLILADLGTCSDILLYAGDGANDADVMEEVAVMGGITLGIGRDAPFVAEYKLPNRMALLSFLGVLDTTLEKRKPQQLTRLSKHLSGGMPS